MEQYSSQLLDNAVEQFAKLPGIGKKTALRLVLHLLRQPIEESILFSEVIKRMRTEIKFCSICNNISDNDVCNICSDSSRDKTTICVVENIKDIIFIENTAQYKGLYHVLGGIISPIDGIGPSDLKIEMLEKRIQEGVVNELILALSATTEGDTTSFYLYKKFEKYNITFSTIARGIAVGDELEYTDIITLGRSIANRIPFQLNK